MTDMQAIGAMATSMCLVFVTYVLIGRIRALASRIDGLKSEMDHVTDELEQLIGKRCVLDGEPHARCEFVDVRLPRATARSRKP